MQPKEAKMTITATQQAQAAANQYVIKQLKNDEASKPFHAAITAANETKAALAHKRQQLTNLKQLTALGVEHSMRDMNQAATKQFETLRTKVKAVAEKLVAAATPAMPEVDSTYSARIADMYNGAGNRGRRELMVKAISGDAKVAAALVHEAEQGFISITPVMQQQLRKVVAPAPELDETASMRLQLAQIANDALAL